MPPHWPSSARSRREIQSPATFRGSAVDRAAVFVGDAAVFASVFVAASFAFGIAVCAIAGLALDGAAASLPPSPGHANALPTANARGIKRYFMMGLLKIDL